MFVWKNTNEFIRFKRTEERGGHISSVGEMVIFMTLSENAARGRKIVSSASGICSVISFLSIFTLNIIGMALGLGASRSLKKGSIIAKELCIMLRIADVPLLAAILLVSHSFAGEIVFKLCFLMAVLIAAFDMVIIVSLTSSDANAYFLEVYEWQAARQAKQSEQVRRTEMSEFVMQNGSPAISGQNESAEFYGQTVPSEYPGQAGAPGFPGQAGSYELYGQTGSPEYSGQAGAYELYGQTGSPEYSGQAGSYELYGQNGSPEFTGQAGSSDFSRQTVSYEQFRESVLAGPGENENTVLVSDEDKLL